MSNTDATHDELSPAERDQAEREAASARAEQDALRHDREKASRAAEREVEKARKDAEHAERDREKAERQREKAAQGAQKEEERRTSELVRSLREAERDASRAQREAEKAALDAALARQRAEAAVDKALRRAAIVDSHAPAAPGATPAGPVPRLPSDVAILWRSVEPARHGPRPGLSLDLIAEAGIALADADGLGAVSMARVAESLGFTTMSLYRYVSSKDDVVALMTDAAIGSPPDHPALADGPWRAAVEQWVVDRASIVRIHPWLANTTAAVQALGPNHLAWADRIVAALDGTGLTPGEKLDTGGLLGAHLLNMVRVAVGVADLAGTAVAGSSPDAGPASTDYAALMAALADPVAHPALHAAVHAESPTLRGEAPDGPDSHQPDTWPLDFGVRRILDGIGVLVAQRAPG